MYKIVRQEKTTGKRHIQTRQTEAEALEFINNLLTNYEKQKTKELLNQGKIANNMYYSKYYYYIIL